MSRLLHKLFRRYQYLQVQQTGTAADTREAASNYMADRGQKALAAAMTQFQMLKYGTVVAD